MIWHGGDAMDARELVTVKISSEAAGYLSISQVVVQQMPLPELVGVILGVTGKNLDRVCEVLRRGVLVADASRFRWPGWDADADAIRRVFDAFPDSDPLREFNEDLCVRAVLGGEHCRIEIAREAGQARPLLRRGSFWDALMRVAGAVRPRYLEYSFKDKADRYRVDLSKDLAIQVYEAAKRLRYSAIKARIAASAIEWVELHTAR
jgi:hypothetical protein